VIKRKADRLIPNTNKKADKFHENRVIFENSSNLRKAVIVFVIVLLLLISILLISVVNLRKNASLPPGDKRELNEFAKVHSIENNLDLDTKSNQKFLNRKIENKTDVYAFYVNYDKKSKISLKSNIELIDVLVPEWFQLDANLELKSNTQSDVGKLAKRHHKKVVPLINNVVNGEWNQEIIHKLLNSPKAQSTLINNLRDEIKKYGYDGVNIDFEFNNSGDRDLMTSFMRELYRSFHQEGLLVSIDVQASNNSYDLHNLEKYCDHLILMLYDENLQTPGPISSQDWYFQTLSNVSKEKLIVSLGNYGYDWETGHAGKVVSFEEIMRMAEKAHLNIEWDDRSKSPYLRYEINQKLHQLWFLDSTTFYNQWKAALSIGVKGIALWRLGTEDPAVWNVVEGSKVNTLTSAKNGDITYNYGEGSILRLLTDQQEGKRSLDFDDSGFIKRGSYPSLPKASEIERLNQPSTSKEVVLTFDDGPDPEYTKKILEILKEHHVKATFFIIGKDAIEHPDIVKQLYQEGYEIGNHTFSHPNIYKISDQQLKLELNMNERIIQAITGHSSSLFRSPYGDNINMYDGDHTNPYVKTKFHRLINISQMGYITVNYDVDSADWKLKDNNKIVQNVMEQVSNGDIILLHDGGGDRTATVQALPTIIDKLKKQGYSFVTVGNMMGKNKGSVYSSIPNREKPYIQVLKMVINIIPILVNVLLELFYLAVILFLVRLTLFLYLAWKHKKNSLSVCFTEGFKPFVSVVIAAYNEEKVIGRTIQSVLDSHYENMEVIVIDDGSRDQTSTVVTANFSNHAKVRLLVKSNGGKSSAINMGISKAAKGAIIVSIDADTIISPDAISLLVRHFEVEKVAAVSGNVKVGNVRNLITTWQHVEYVTGFNLEKRAYAMLNCVTVVPGAIGAWRKEVIEKLGGFTNDTLAEDTDLTLQILAAGYKVEIEEQAYAYTEAPENSRDFLKQRFRWSFGTLQCLWKHHKAFWGFKHKSLSFIALPSILLFQFIVPFFAPFLDILMIIGLISGNFKQSILFYVGYFIVDFLICSFTLKLEKSKLTSLLWLFLQRIIYRYLLMWVSWKSVFKAIKGGYVGWGKLERTGNIEVRKAG
jgi:peptidoglycan-N-acetylglucosamine deacetylase